MKSKMTMLFVVPAAVGGVLCWPHPGIRDPSLRARYDALLATLLLHGQALGEFTVNRKHWSSVGQTKNTQVPITCHISSYPNNFLIITSM